LVGNSLKGTQKYGVVGDAFQYIVFETPRPNFEVLRDWNWDTDPQLTVERGNLLDATDPNLSAFYAHKGKLLMFQGFADMSSNPLANSFAYYENVVKVMPQSRDFVAYYMVPGMGHCSGGIGCDKVDWFTPMVNWVEKGIEPGALIGATSTGTPRTRPICRYPEVARYSGSGSIDDAASFMCVPPVEVRLEPETLNLKSKDVFTAFITMPRGFDVRDWHIHDVTCEGASAVKGMAFREGYIATFRTRDLKEVSLEKAVVLTVKLAFYHDGKDALTQGSDTVRVIREDRDRGHEEWGHNDHHNRGKVALEWER
jgi:hypothetical protein